jgi:uncharacterized protein
VSRCAAGAPAVVAMAPVLDDGSLFPTTFWLTCPRLVEAVHDLESSGAGARMSERIAGDPDLAASVVAADAAYRAARLAEGDGVDPCAGVGVAGQRDPRAVKCLHARLAAHLAGVPDPVGALTGEAVAGVIASACDEARCHAPVVPGC